MSESTDLSALKARLEDVEARQAILDAGVCEILCPVRF